jgi:hypothetical protein
VKSAIASAVILAACLGVAAAPASAQTSSRSARVLSCKDKNGQVIYADPADPRCYQPPKTPDEQAADEARRQKLMEAYRECKARERSDSSLLSRYPNQDKHDAARRQALAEVDAALKISQARLEQLRKEQKRLGEEAEFYPNGNLPPKLKRDLDTNNALIDAQIATIQTQKDGAAQKNAFYDAELAKLKTLWSPQGERRGCVYPQG